MAGEFLAAEAAGEDSDGEHAPQAAGSRDGASSGHDSGGGDGTAQAIPPAAGGHDSGAGRDDSGDRLAWYGDSAYGTGDLRGAIDDAGHDAVIKPKPPEAPVEGGFTVDDFTVDEQAGTVT